MSPSEVPSEIERLRKKADNQRRFYQEEIVRREKAEAEVERVRLAGLDALLQAEKERRAEVERVRGVLRDAYGKLWNQAEADHARADAAEAKVRAVVTAIETLLDDADQVTDSPQRPNTVSVWGLRKALEPYGGRPHRWQHGDPGLTAAPRTEPLTFALGRIAEAHCKAVDEHGGTWGDCAECGLPWPCPTYAWSTGGRGGFDTWDPADDAPAEVTPPAEQRAEDGEERG